MVRGIHKKGLKSEVGPVSITSVINKWDQSFATMLFMSSNKLFSTMQHGFVPSRNYMTNLLLAMEEWADQTCY